MYLAHHNGSRARTGLICQLPGPGFKPRLRLYNSHDDFPNGQLWKVPYDDSGKVTVRGLTPDSPHPTLTVSVGVGMEGFLFSGRIGKWSYFKATGNAVEEGWEGSRELADFPLGRS